MAPFLLNPKHAEVLEGRSREIRGSSGSILRWLPVVMITAFVLGVGQLIIGYERTQPPDPARRAFFALFLGLPTLLALFLIRWNLRRFFRFRRLARSGEIVMGRVVASRVVSDRESSTWIILRYELTWRGERITGEQKDLHDGHAPGEGETVAVMIANRTCHWVL